MKQHSVVRRSGDARPSLEVRIKAEEEVLAEAFKAAEVSQLADPPQLEPCEPLGPVSSMKPAPPAPPATEPHLVSVCDQKPLLDNQSADLRSAEQTMRLVSLLRDSSDRRPLCIQASESVGWDLLLNLNPSLVKVGNSLVSGLFRVSLRQQDSSVTENIITHSHKQMLKIPGGSTESPSEELMLPKCGTKQKFYDFAPQDQR